MSRCTAPDPGNECEAAGGVNAGEPTRLRLTYLIGSYPVLTETFIDREIEGLLRAGVELQIVSIRQPGSNLSPAQMAGRGRVMYLLPPSLLRLAAAQLVPAVRRPGAYFGTLLWLLTRRHAGASRAKTALHFFTGAYAAWVLRNRHGVHIHAHFVDRAATVALVASRLLDTTYSVTAHAADLYAKPALLAERIGQAAFAATCTRYNQQYLSRLLGPIGDGVLLIYHGLELALYDGHQSRADGPSIIVSVGQLKEKKGHRYLVEACRILLDQGRDVRCVIVGAGPLDAELKGQIQELGLTDRVSLAGPLPHEDVIDQYRNAAAFVLPCVVAADGDRDGIPNAILEAMAMRLPVVSTPISGIPEVVHDGKTGHLVPPRDAAAIARALGSLLDDPSAAREMGAAGRAFVAEEFDIDRNLTRLLRAFVDAAAR